MTGIEILSVRRSVPFAYADIDVSITVSAHNLKVARPVCYRSQGYARGGSGLDCKSKRHTSDYKKITNSKVLCIVSFSQPKKIRVSD